MKRLQIICKQDISISFAHTFSRKSRVGQHDIEGLRGFTELNVPITVEPGITKSIGIPAVVFVDIITIQFIIRNKMLF